MKLRGPPIDPFVIRSEEFQHVTLRKPEGTRPWRFLHTEAFEEEQAAHSEDSREGHPIGRALRRGNDMQAAPIDDEIESFPELGIADVIHHTGHANAFLGGKIRGATHGRGGEIRGPCLKVALRQSNCLSPSSCSQIDHAPPGDVQLLQCQCHIGIEFGPVPGELLRMALSIQRFKSLVCRLSDLIATRSN